LTLNEAIDLLLYSTDDIRTVKASKSFISPAGAETPSIVDGWRPDVAIFGLHAAFCNLCRRADTGEAEGYHISEVAAENKSSLKRDAG